MRSSFYATSTLKVVALHVLTLGLYRFYWFYRQWQTVRDRKRVRISPLGRALFFPFFAQALFGLVKDESRERGYEVRWSPSVIALAVFVLVAAEQVVAWTAATGTHWPGTSVLFLQAGTMAWAIGIATTLLSAIPLAIVQETIGMLGRRQPAAATSAI